jgi:hypothetical protein
LEGRDVPTAYFVDPLFTATPTPDNFTVAGADKVPAGGLVLNTNAFTTLRLAIEAANANPGPDTIYLATTGATPITINPSSGTTEAGATTKGTVQITDPLAIVGQGKQQTLVTVSGATDASTGATSSVFRTTGPRLDVSGFTFSGRSQEFDPTTFAQLFPVGGAFRYEGGVGSVTNVTVRDLAYTDVDASNNPVFFGNAVVATGAGSQVTVDNSAFVNFGRTGVVLFRTGAVQQVVENSTFVGSAAGFNFGVQVADGATNALITGNTITGSVGTVGGGQSAGVAIAQGSTSAAAFAKLIGNTISGNNFAVLVGAANTDASSALIQHNNILGNGSGIGLVNPAATVNALFNWWGSPAGPQAASNPGGNPESFVDPGVTFQDANVAPSKGILQSATPVLAADPAAADPAADYRAKLPKATVTVAAQAKAAPGGSPLTFTVDFSEAVFGVTKASFTASTDNPTLNPTVTAVAPASVDGKSYTVTVGVAAGASGTVTLAANAAATSGVALTTPPADPAVAPGLFGAQSLFSPRTALFGGTAAGTGASTVVDAAAPVGSVTTPSVTASTTQNNPVGVTVQFTEPVTGFDATDITVAAVGAGSTAAGKVLSVTPAADGKTFTVLVGNLSGAGQLGVSVAANAAQDAVGNASAAFSATVATVDVTAPTATGPTGLPATGVTKAPVTLTIAFDEAVSGFDKTDVQVGGTAGGSVTAFTASADGKTFTVTVGGFAKDGTVTVSLPAGAGQDAAGNPTPAIAPQSFAVDTTPPVGTVVLPPNVPTPQPNRPVSVAVQFSEPVTGFDASKVTVTGTAGGTVLGVVPGATGAAYTVIVGNFTGSGTVGVGLASNAGQDAAGNTAAAVPAATVATIDAVAPTASVAAVTTDANNRPTGFTIQFSEAVAPALTKAAVTVGGTAGGAVTSFTQVNATTYQVGLGGFTNAGGTVTLAVAAGATADAAGNPAGGLSVTLPVPAVPTVPPPPPPVTTPRGFAVGGGDIGGPAGGTNPSQPFFLVNATAPATAGGSPTLTPSGGIVPFEPGFTGGVRVATADLNGDGTLDVIVGPGPGRAAEVLVYDGKDTTAPKFRFSPFGDFGDGLFVNVITLNGKPQVIVTPDQGGGPRVSIFDGSKLFAGTPSTIANFIGIGDPDFRGGARAVGGDVNGDGTDDLIVSAGFGGGPRIAIYDGVSVATGTQSPTKLIGDFFVIDPNLRDGAYVAAGDLDADGKADLLFGAGRGGPPQVQAFSGAAVLAQGVANGRLVATPLADANLGSPPTNTGGLRVAARDLDGDGVADVIIGPGEGGGSRVNVFNGKTFRGGSPPAFSTLDLFGGFTNGVFVG